MIRVAFLLYDDFLIQDMAGPATVFELANEYCDPGYSMEMLGASGENVRTSSGIGIAVSNFRESQGCDILVLPGGMGAFNSANYSDLLDFIKDVAADGREIAGICTGAFLLAEAGLLNGKRAATHWGAAAELAKRYPAVDVDADSLYLTDGNIWTSAGITAGIDLSLAIVERDYGTDVARHVAKAMVVQYKRPGTQSQHSALLDLINREDKFSGILAWARNRLDQPLTVEQLADQAGLSPRQFSRKFTAAVGVSPAKAIERLRLECALAAIETNRWPLDQIARSYGFNNTDRMRRSFTRTFGETPAAIRRRARERLSQ